MAGQDGCHGYAGVPDALVTIHVAAVALECAAAPEVWGPNASPEEWICPWIADGMAQAEPFGGDAVAAAAVVVWLSPADHPALSHDPDILVQAILDAQSPDGSWSGDPFTTAMCLEALRKDCQ
jgi:hypothetical protein